MSWNSVPDTVPAWNSKESARMEKRFAELKSKAIHKNRSGHVYFIYCPDKDRIKIGYSNSHPDRRLMEIRSCCPVEIEPMAFMDGTLMLERELHIRFIESCELGEWFKATS